MSWPLNRDRPARGRRVAGAARGRRRSGPARRHGDGERTVVDATGGSDEGECQCRRHRALGDRGRRDRSRARAVGDEDAHGRRRRERREGARSGRFLASGEGARSGRGRGDGGRGPSPGPVGDSEDRARAEAHPRDRHHLAGDRDRARGSSRVAGVPRCHRRGRPARGDGDCDGAIVHPSRGGGEGEAERRSSGGVDGSGRDADCARAVRRGHDADGRGSRKGGERPRRGGGLLGREGRAPVAGRRQGGRVAPARSVGEGERGTRAEGDAGDAYHLARRRDGACRDGRVAGVARCRRRCRPAGGDDDRKAPVARPAHSGGVR